MISHYNLVMYSYMSHTFYNLECTFLPKLVLKVWGRVLLTNVIAGAFFCRADEFICNNTLCKLHTWMCDGKDDCGDNSDEDIDMCGGLNCHSEGFSLKKIDAYFIRHYFSFSQEGIFHCLLIQDSMQLF